MPAASRILHGVRDEDTAPRAKPNVAAEDKVSPTTTSDPEASTATPVPVSSPLPPRYVENASCEMKTSGDDEPPVWLPTTRTGPSRSWDRLR